VSSSTRDAGRATFLPMHPAARAVCFCFSSSPRRRCDARRPPATPPVFSRGVESLSKRPRPAVPVSRHGRDFLVCYHRAERQSSNRRYGAVRARGGRSQLAAPLRAARSAESVPLTRCDLCRSLRARVQHVDQVGASRSISQHATPPQQETTCGATHAQAFRHDAHSRLCPHGARYHRDHTGCQPRAEDSGYERASRHPGQDGNRSGGTPSEW